MAEKRRGLGRGLGALISSAPSSDETSEVSDGGTADRSVQAVAGGDSTDEAQSVSRETLRTESEPIGDSRGSGTPRMGSTRSEGADVGAISDESPVEVTRASERKPALDAAAGAKFQAPTASGGKSADRKTRPVDMFFTPGKSAADSLTNEKPAASNGAGDDVRAETRSPRTKATGKRPQMPDFIGEVRGRGSDGARSRSEVDSSAVHETTAGISGPSEDSARTSSAEETDRSIDSEVSRETLVAVPGASFAEIPVDKIHPNRKQPRTDFDQEDMAELVHSIKEVGLLQPIVVRPSPEGGDAAYELVMGERRWRATQEAGLATIPAIIRATTDMDLLRDALLENLHRSQLNPLEEAAAYQQLLQEFGCTQDELSERIGRSRPQISNTIRLMKLPALVQRRVAAGVLSAGHARALLALADVGDMERLAQRIVNEGLSVRATEEIVALSDGLRRPAKESSPRTTARHERLDFLATSLSDRLDTSVKITLGAKKGRVSIEFASVDDLNRIMGVISPGSPN